MLDFTIYSYGYSEIIFHTLQALAMFRNSDFYTIVISTVALLAGVTYALHMIAARGEGEWRQSLRQVIGMMVFINTLMLPTTTMSIKDNVEKHYWQVDNIPLAFALPIGIVENFGHILTVGFEQVFSLVDGASSHNYYHYGSVFGARLQKEVLQAKIRNPEFISNMSNFIERCVILPSMIGKQFTKEELVASSDMWGLISSRAGTFTRTPMTINGTRVDPHPKCKDAVPYFEKKFNEAIGFNITSWSWKFKGAGNSDKYNPGTRALNQNIKTQIAALYGTTHSVDSILKHNMMINSINSYRSGKYPAAKAQLHSEAGGLISGDLAEKTLTGSLAIMKVVIYGSFIFLFPLLLLSGGISKYRSWIVAAFSLALWPSLFSMLNMIIDFAYQPATIVSYSSWSTELKKFDSIASTAANLTLMIPFLSFWITRMAEGGFMHLAGSIMATANSASSALAGEKASGSRSWDNESMRNQNSDNVSNYKHDTNMQYVSGAARNMLSDGSMETITAGGKALYFGGSGQSSSIGESTYRQSDGNIANYHLGVREETQMMASEQASYSQTQEKLFSQEASALYGIMQSHKTDSGYNIDTSTERGREMVKALNAVDSLNKTNDYGWKQNAEAHLKAEYSAGGTIAKVIAGVDIGVGGSISAINESSQTDASSSSVLSENSTHARDGNSQKTGKTDNILDSLGVDKNTQDSIRESYQKAQRLEKSLSAHRDKINSYNEATEYTRNHSNEFSKDMYQDVLDEYQRRYHCSARDAQKAVSDGNYAAKIIHRELSSPSADQVMSHIAKKGKDINHANDIDDFVQKHQLTSDIGSKRDAFANRHNIPSQDSATQNISSKAKYIKDQHFEQYNRNNDEYKEIQDMNTNQQTARQVQMDKYEEDRIGKGKIGKVMGGASNIVSLGNAGWDIGRPNQQSNDDLDFEPIARPYNPQRPPEDTKSFDKVAAQKLLDSFDKGDDLDFEPTEAQKIMDSIKQNGNNT